MLRVIKRVACVGVLAAGASVAQAFSLLGPFNVAWQVADLGYNYTGNDLGGVMNIGEEYRRNIPVLYYACDANYYGYFGAEGVAAVDQAFAILNALQPVSSYSADLSEVPLEAARFNQTAGALNLRDLKSTVLAIMVEELGLADPIRYTWTLHDRTVGAACPIGNQYLVTKRNLSIVPSNLDQLQYSSYVNGVLFTYFIDEYCANVPPGFPTSQAREVPVDVPANAARFAPVASYNSPANIQFPSASYGLYPGSFLNGVTRDDIAGLRYMLRSGNVNWEDVPENSVVFFTNNVPTALTNQVTTNLALLVAQSLTNDDAALVGLYPGLAVVPGSTIPYFTNVLTTNVSSYLTNYPLDPIGTPPHQIFLTNYTTNVIFAYNRQFANVVTQSFSAKSWVTIIDTTLDLSPYAPVGTPPTTNTTTTNVRTNIATGDFYIIPTNSCGLMILSNVLTTPMSTTNVLVVTNLPATSNLLGGSYLMSRTNIYWWTNHVLAYFPVLCLTNEPGLRRGIEKITFVKTAYDSLLGKFYIPQTNAFTMTTVTNSTNWIQTFQRVVTEPDFLFTAADLMPGPAAPVDSGSNFIRSVTFNEDNALPRLAGPGVINLNGSNNAIIFNKSGPIFYNFVTNNTWSLDEGSATLRPLWASYDDSTNAPVVYPNGTSLASVESQMMMQVTSTSLPAARTRTAYSTQLTGTGGSSGPPYTWSLASGSPNLPPGLTMTSGGLVSGTPTVNGIYYFFVKMTDHGGGFTVWQVTITVLP
jgi:hypothetical protein